MKMCASCIDFIYRIVESESESIATRQVNNSRNLWYDFVCLLIGPDECEEIDLEPEKNSSTLRKILDSRRILVMQLFKSEGYFPSGQYFTLAAFLNP